MGPGKWWQQEPPAPCRGFPRRLEAPATVAPDGEPKTLRELGPPRERPADLGSRCRPRCLSREGAVRVAAPDGRQEERKTRGLWLRVWMPFRFRRWLTKPKDKPRSRLTGAMRQATHGFDGSNAGRTREIGFGGRPKGRGVETPPVHRTLPIVWIAGESGPAYLSIYGGFEGTSLFMKRKQPQ
jgi:hypothetical protein